jgi:hypothetical protein
MRHYSLDIDFQFCSALNPDCSIHKNCYDSQWLFAIQAFCFVEDTILFHLNLIVNLVMIINSRTILVCCVKTGLALSIISNFIPVGYKRYVEEHVQSKYCCTWRGFKDCLIGRANSPCHIVKEDINIIGGY